MLRPRPGCTAPAFLKIPSESQALPGLELLGLSDASHSAECTLVSKLMCVDITQENTRFLTDLIKSCS